MRTEKEWKLLEEYLLDHFANDENLQEKIKYTCKDRTDDKLMELVEYMQEDQYYEKAEVMSYLSNDETKENAILDNFPIGIKGMRGISFDQIIASIVSSFSSDERKLEWLKNFESEYDKSNIISSISDDDLKIKLLSDIVTDNPREEIMKSISDDEKKLEAVNRVPWWNRRIYIEQTLKSDSKKIKLIEESTDLDRMTELAMSIVDDDIRNKYLTDYGINVEEEDIKIRMVRAIPDKNKKLQIAMTIPDEDDDLRLDLISEEDIFDLYEEYLESQKNEKINLKEENEMEEKNVIDIAKLGEKIGMVPQEKTLPNGKVVNTLVWDQENLIKAVKEVAYMSEEGKPVSITGAAPAWLVSALTHTVHPCPVGLYDPKLGRDIDIPQLAHGETNPEGEVAFKTTEKGDSILIEYNMDLPEGITAYDENNLSKVVVPEVSNGKAVYLSGRGPNYLTVAIAEAYAHTNSSVSLFQPGIGYTCAITHSRSKGLGDLMKDPLGQEEIKEQLVTAKEEKTQEESSK